jgi:hypothetical protein
VRGIIRQGHIDVRRQRAGPPAKFFKKRIHDWL